MRAREIEIGVVYECQQRWLRKPIAMRENRGVGGPYTEVRFEAGRDPSALLPQPSWCHIDWFAAKCLHRFHT